MILNLVEAGRLAQGLQALGAEVTAAVIYGWLWLGCAAAGTPGVLLLGPDEVSAAFGWSASYSRLQLECLVEKGLVVMEPGLVYLPQYLRAPADAEQARIWAHHLWEVQRKGHDQAARFLEQKILSHCTGARSLRRAYELARNP